MFFANILDIFIPIAKDNIPEKIIVRMIMIRFCVVMAGNRVFIATAVPERALLIEYRATKERAITIVFIEPTRKRNDLLSCFVISEAIVAA